MARMAPGRSPPLYRELPADPQDRFLARWCHDGRVARSGGASSIPPRTRACRPPRAASMIDPSRSWRRIAASVAVALVGGVVWAGWWPPPTGPVVGGRRRRGRVGAAPDAPAGSAARRGRPRRAPGRIRIDQEGSDTGEVVEGRNARFEITITDTTGQIVPARVYPSAWAAAHANDAPPLTPGARNGEAGRIIDQREPVQSSGA